MKKKLLFITLVFLFVGGNLMAQRQIYICRGGQADAYEVSGMTQLEMMPDSFRIRQQPAYAIEEVDSIVFRHPLLPCRELGWWGDVTDGQSFYKARLRAEIDDDPEAYELDFDEFEPFDYDVLFIIEAQDGICQTVRCELHFSEEWMSMVFYYAKLFILKSGREDPYIYVKETETGPRRFETWRTNTAGLPYGYWWEEGSTMLQSDFSDLLTGRPMEDVQVIVEAWVHQTPRQEVNPNYHQ